MFCSSKRSLVVFPLLFYISNSNLFNFICYSISQWAPRQGQTGRFFQIRVGSGSGIGKNFGFGSGSGSGSGIGTVFFINRVLSGNENIDRVFSGISISRLRFQN